MKFKVNTTVKNCEIANTEEFVIDFKSNIKQISDEMVKCYEFGIGNWCKQNNDDDSKTNFIYSTILFSDLLLKSEELPLSKELRDYAINRWYNYMSSKLSEGVFCEVGIERGDVIKESDVKNHDRDIFLKNSKGEYIPFDVKNSVFPKKFKGEWGDKNGILSFLLKNASREKRHHTKNRLFLIFKDKEDKSNYDKIYNAVNSFIENTDMKCANFDGELSIYGVIFV